MKLGAHVRTLVKLRLGLVLSIVVGALAAIISTHDVTLLPPGVHSRALEIAAASTEVMIDTPHSTITNLAATDTNLAGLTARADLLGNIMDTAPVLDYMGRALHVDPARLQVDTPITADVPRLVIEPGSGQSAAALVASADQYKLQIQADPAVPILHIYAQAPTKVAAIGLANASVSGLRSYVTSLSVRQKVAPGQQVQLLQFGPATGGVVNHGMNIEVATLAFFTGFLLTSIAMLLIVRAAEGYRLAALSEQVVS